MPPQSFGPYALQDLLGRGGMGEVHRAYDTEHNRTVALKLLSPELAADPGFRERFRREAYATASLNEPHVIPIHRYGEIDGRLFLDMRLVEGESLEDRLGRTGALPPAEALQILEQTAAALDAAHAARLVHRDVKPSNILLTGRPDHPFAYLVDFGIAHSASDLSGPALTRTGSAVGTFDYMAPERFQQQPATPAVDVYALACVLYECITARRPFTGDTLPALIYAHLDTLPTPASTLQPRVPPALDHVLQRGLAKDPAARPATAGALIDLAWDAVRVNRVPPQSIGRPPAGPTVAGAPVPPPPGSPAPATRTGGRRRSALVAGIVAAVVVLAGLSVFLWQTLGRDDPAGSDGRQLDDAAATTSAAEITTGEATGGTSPPAADPEVPDATPIPVAAGDSYYDGAAERCLDGVVDKCDELFTPEVPAALSAWGSTCGGRTEELRGGCLDHFLGDPDPPTGLGNDPTLDALAAECHGGGWGACDDLWVEGDSGTFYESYGETCGGRLPPPLRTEGTCFKAGG